MICESPHFEINIAFLTNFLHSHQLTCVAVIPFFMASFTVSLSNLPTIRFGYLVRISINKLRIAISSSFAINPGCLY